MVDTNAAAPPEAVPAETGTAPGGFFESTPNVYDLLEAPDQPDEKTKSAGLDLEHDDETPAPATAEGSEAPTGETGGKPEAKPAEKAEPTTPELTGLTPELAAKFGELKTTAPELAEFMVAQEKERSAFLTRKAQEYSAAIKDFQDFRPAFEDKSVGNALRFILSDEEAGQAVADVIRAVISARQAGQPFNLKTSFAPPPPDELSELLGKDEDEMMNAFMTQPGYLKALISKLTAPPKAQPAPASAPGGTTQAAKPAQDPSPAADPNALVSRFFASRPEADRNPEFVGQVTEWVKQHEEALVREGHGPEAILIAAYSAVTAKRDAAEAAKKQADQDKAKTAQQERRGLPPQGAGHTEEDADDELGLKSGSFFAKS